MGWGSSLIYILEGKDRAIMQVISAIASNRYKNIAIAKGIFE